MATATRSRRTTKKVAAPVEDLEDDELDAELEEEDETPAPKKRAAAKKTPAKKAAPAKEPKADVLGSTWLKDHVNETLSASHESTKLRVVLRKLIKDGTIESPKDGRYIFTGPRDPNVKAVIAALRAEAKSGPAKRGRKAKAAAVATEVDDSEEDVEDLDLDEE